MTLEPEEPNIISINFDVLKKNNWTNFELNTAYNRVVMLIEKVTDLYAEWIKML
jgi:hypothetical protein